MKMKIIESVPNSNVFFRESTVKAGNLPVNSEGGIVNIFDEFEYQEILGFGGAFTEAAAYNYSLMSSKNKKKFMQAYFGKKDGIGYNFGRTHINSCDFALDIYTYVKDGDKTLDTFDISRDKKYIIPFIKDALEYTGDEMVLFASPWSPPAYMKDNHSPIRGGKLLEEYKEAWALYYAKYVKAFKNEGINISAISVQNEPKALQSWESCYYDAADEREFVKNYLIPVLDREGLSYLKIIVWDHNKERVYDRAKEIFADEAVKARVWAVGYHWYTGDHFDGLRLVHEKFDKPLICTEFCGTINQEKGGLTLAERYAYDMAENFNNYQTASCDWNLLLSTNGGPYHNRNDQSVSIPGAVFDDINGGCYAPIMYNKNDDKLELTPVYYYIGHFSKYVKRGAKRIAYSKHTDNLTVCPFVNPDGSKVVIIMNSSDASIPANIRYDGVCTEIITKPHSIQTVVF